MPPAEDERPEGDPPRGGDADLPPQFRESEGAPPPAPIFVNPDRPAPGSGAPPLFTQPGPGRASQPVAGGPVFVRPGGAGLADGSASQPVPGGPVFVKPHGQAPSPVDTDRPWRWWVGPVTFLVAFAVVFVLGIFVVILSGGSDSAFDDNEHWLGLAQDILWVAVVLLVPFMAARYLTPAQLGLRKAPLGRSIGVLIGCLLAFYLLAAVYAAATGVGEDDNTLLQDTGFGDSVMRDVVYALLFTVAAPVAEELLFRGLLFRTLRDGLSRLGPRAGLWLGAIISGVIFGGIHVGGGQDDFLPVLMILGVLLALAYHWSGTIYVPVVLHSINNAIATGANSEPSADWIYVLIGLGPVISILVLLALGGFVRSVFPQEPPEAPAEPPLVSPSGRPANL